LADVRAGRLDGLSIGYVATKSHKDNAGRRVLDQVNLKEISIVKKPASSRARVLSVKSEPSSHLEGLKGMAEPNTSTADNDGDENQDVTDRLGALESSVADHGARLGKIESSMGGAAKSIKSIETILRRPGSAGVMETKSEPEMETKSFTRFLRQGREALDQLEVKYLRIADDTGAGYLAPQQFINEIVKNIVLVSPVRQVAKVMQTSAQQILLPRRTATTTVTWVGESSARPSTQPAYGALEFQVKEMACYVDVSNAMLEDSAFDLAAELAGDLGEQFGKAEGAAFVNGTGVNQPLGFMAPSLGITAIHSGNASALTADSLMSLFHALPTFYATNAVWAMNRTTLGAIRTLKDGNGRYMLSFDGMPGNPAATILGRPVVEMPDMPNVGAGTYPVVFGDFKQGYRIFDRLSLSILRDPYSQQTNGLVRFHARRRVAGSVAKTEAFVQLLVAA